MNLGQRTSYLFHRRREQRDQKQRMKLILKKKKKRKKESEPKMTFTGMCAKLLRIDDHE